MALNITEATAVNRIYRWLTAAELPDRPVSDDMAHEAMLTLARAAHRSLGAGVTDTQVRAQRDRWPLLEPRSG